VDVSNGLKLPTRENVEKIRLYEGFEKPKVNTRLHSGGLEDGLENVLSTSCLKINRDGLTELRKNRVYRFQSRR